MDDGRRARWGLLLGYGTGAALTVWVVLVGGSVVDSDWLSSADVPRSDDGSRHQAFESPSPADERETTVAAARRPSSGVGSAFGGLQALTTARLPVGAATTQQREQPPEDDADPSVGTERAAVAGRAAPPAAEQVADGTEELAATAPDGDRATRPVEPPADETTNDATTNDATTNDATTDEAAGRTTAEEEEGGSFAERADGLGGPTRSAP